MQKSTLPLTLGSILLASSGLATSADLELIVSNIDSSDGTIYIALFDSEANFKSDEPLRAMSNKPELSEIRLSMSDLPAGNYAVMVYHDVNGNTDLDANLFGIPKEPWGASLNGTQVFGPPTWSDVSFEVSESDNSVEIALR